MIIVWLAALGATIVVALFVALVYLFARKNRPEPRALAIWAGRLWLFNFLLDLAIFYIGQPALTGPYGGWQWLLWPILLTGLLALFGGSFTQVRSTFETFSSQINGDRPFRASFSAPRRNGSRNAGIVDDKPQHSGSVLASGAAGTAAIAFALIVAIVFNGLIGIATTWFDGNAKALSAIPKLITEKPSTPLPPTDVNHIVLVTQGVASYLGQQVLAQNGQNLGSTYHTEETGYTLQSVKGHLYWIAPLVYNNVWANLGRLETPGFVVVDAEDPNAEPQLRTGYHLRYLPDAILNMDLLRHVYLSGYTDGNLVDPTLEVDDSFRPYFTVSLMQSTRGFTGDVVSRVLLVDPQSGGITSYAPGDVPSWVDRILPASAVDQYLTWWGQYATAPWFNPSGAGIQRPATAEPELVYNTVDQPVWLEAMTSGSSTDNSATGVVLFDTKDMTGHFYPLSGLGVTANVTHTFESNPANIRGYKVANVQLYQIYNVPTWVATFVQDNAYGESFQAVGIVDARQLNGANVIMASNKQDALANYAQWLQDRNTGGGGLPTGQQLTVQGKVTRIQAATENGTSIYYLLIDGQSRIFRAPLGLSPELPLVQPGDQVRVQFADTEQSVITVSAFVDLSISVGTPVATPAATPSP
jgi:hypothetical protein